MNVGKAISENWRKRDWVAKPSRVCDAVLRDLREHLVDAIAKLVDKFADFVFGNDKRRREQHMVAALSIGARRIGIANQPILKCGFLDAARDVELWGEWLLCLPVRH